MSVEEDGFVHRLHISNPKTDDMGKYSCDINGISTSAFLEVEGESSDVCSGINWQETASHKVPRKALSTVFSSKAMTRLCDPSGDMDEFTQPILHILAEYCRELPCVCLKDT